MTTNPAQDADNKKALKPCPFCSGKGFLNHLNPPQGEMFWVSCQSCQMQTIERNNKAAAISAWNTRTTPAPQSEKMEVRLLEAFGMFLNGMAYYETFPDNEEDAKQLSKSATYNFLRARNHIDDQTADACSMACKSVYAEEYKKEKNNG